MFARFKIIFFPVCQLTKNLEPLDRVHSGDSKKHHSFNFFISCPLPTDSKASCSPQGGRICRLNLLPQPLFRLLKKT